MLLLTKQSKWVDGGLTVCNTLLNISTTAVKTSISQGRWLPTLKHNPVSAWQLVQHQHVMPASSHKRLTRQSTTQQEQQQELLNRAHCWAKGANAGAPPPKLRTGHSCLHNSARVNNNHKEKKIKNRGGRETLAPHRNNAATWDVRLLRHSDGSTSCGTPWPGLPGLVLYLLCCKRNAVLTVALQNATALCTTLCASQISLSTSLHTPHVLWCTQTKNPTRAVAEVCSKHSRSHVKYTCLGP